ncbi:MAG TPA: c-type cytochrome [Candidatus Acidoferrum sp.]|nr:c-type cytochrome [Candidatus Acidoferrum sp.]
MRTRFTVLGLSLLFVALVYGVSASWSKPKPVTPDKAQIERGRYIVEDVAMCGECHSPRDANGELDQHAWLQGAPIWIMPVKPDPNWAMRAPALAGFPSFTEEQGERILERGIGPQGETIRRPMHIYHMSHEDAKAVIAYLKSLPAGNR